MQVRSEELINDVGMVIDDELEWSYNNHGVFPSQYHGYGIILEELKESQEEIKIVAELLEKAFSEIRNNEIPNDTIETLERHAKFLACEAVQTAAMAQKFIESSEGWKK
jgi:hypothetical protein